MLTQVTGKFPWMKKANSRQPSSHPFGRFCPTRGPFGFASMQEIFNKFLDEIFTGMERVSPQMISWYMARMWRNMIRECMRS